MKKGQMKIMPKIYTNSEINKAGKMLVENVSKDEIDKATDIISHWRAAHASYTEIMKNILQKRAGRVDSKAIVVSRLKKLDSIKLKLSLIRDMQLSRMQDIGGCRVVVSNLRKASYLNKILKRFTSKFKLINEKDYILHPKRTGYRGYHLVYEYEHNNKEEYRILVEVQVRTMLQHAWATAVETVGLFTGSALKSNIGDEKWREFFIMVSKLFSLEEIEKREDQKSIIKTLRNFNRSNHFIEQMNSFVITMDKMKDHVSGGYFLLVLDYQEHMLRIRSFSNDELEKASQAYMEAETKSNHNAVLVSAKTFDEIKSGYQNYFGNMQLFLDTYKTIMKR